MCSIERTRESGDLSWSMPWPTMSHASGSAAVHPAFRPMEGEADGVGREAPASQGGAHHRLAAMLAHTPRQMSQKENERDLWLICER